MKNSVRKTVCAAMMAAVVFLATAVISIPNGLNGYINFGDGFVLLCGWLLGPLYGFLAAGIGSCLADLLGGYVMYVPATFLIKGTMALIASWIGGKGKSGIRLLSGLLAETLMVLGYFGFSALLLGNGWGAALSLPGDALQGAVGLTLAMLLFTMLSRLKADRFFSDKR
ncbi:MAG: ECF transporter S component [Ruminococcaceae bacterium]|nr:ECF transporter S component [Oscillospiraceae bacterium]